MKPIIVTYSNESYMLTDVGCNVLNNGLWDVYEADGWHIASFKESDIKLIARPKK